MFTGACITVIALGVGAQPSTALVLDLFATVAMIALMLRAFRRHRGSDDFAG